MELYRDSKELCHIIQPYGRCDYTASVGKKEVQIEKRISQGRQEETYKNPRPKIPTTSIFFRRDMRIRYTTSIGIQSTIKSRAMFVIASEMKKSCRLLTDPTSVQFQDIGRAWKKVVMKKASIQRQTTPIRISFIPLNPGETRLSTKMRR